MGRGRSIAALAATLTGCAATASSTTGTAPDASAAGNVTLHVGLGPLTPPTFRAGVCVRASDGERAVDALTDARGVAQLTLDASRRWDLTAAEPGHVAVSLMGVRPPFETDVLLRGAPGPTSPEARNVEVSGVIRGRSSPGSAVVLEGALGTTVSRTDAFTLTVAAWPGAAPARVVALELDEASGFLNGAISAPIARVEGGSPVAVELPSPPSRPAHTVLQVEYSRVGRVTAAQFDGPVTTSAAQWEYTGSGAGVVPVGRAEFDRHGAPHDGRDARAPYAHRERRRLEPPRVHAHRGRRRGLGGLRPRRDGVGGARSRRCPTASRSRRSRAAPRWSSARACCASSPRTATRGPRPRRRCCCATCSPCAKSAARRCAPSSRGARQPARFTRAA